MEIASSKLSAQKVSQKHIFTYPPPPLLALIRIHVSKKYVNLKIRDKHVMYLLNMALNSLLTIRHYKYHMEAQLHYTKISSNQFTWQKY
jgi:hypothetical protein